VELVTTCPSAHTPAAANAIREIALVASIDGMMTGINLVHVPYRGGYYPDLLSGQVQVAFGAILSCIQYIRRSITTGRQ
jgi:Tripartite tricarboxylate transporter family receptor